MKLPTTKVVLQVACSLALVALAMIVWSLVDPHPIPVILAMSAGQVIGTLSFSAFLLVVVRDLRPMKERGPEISPVKRSP